MRSTVYNATDHKVAELEYDANGAVINRITFDHDLDQRAVIVQARSGAGAMWANSRHTLDNLGHTIESVSFDVTKDESYLIIRKTYDDHGHWIEQRSTEGGRDYRDVVLYEYDPGGNWISRTHRE